MISQIPKHILILVPLAVLFSIPPLILGFKARYTRFAWFAGFTCVATLVFHVILGIITVVSSLRNKVQSDTSIDSPFSEKPSRSQSNAWSVEAPNFEPPSPTSSIASLSLPKPRILRYYKSGSISFQIILLAFWIATWVKAIADTARGPTSDTGSQNQNAPMSMTINAPWNAGVQVAEIIFVLIECVVLGVLVVKCWRVKRRIEARRAFIAEERKFNIVRSNSIQREPSLRRTGGVTEDLSLPTVPSIVVHAPSRFSVDSPISGPVKGRAAPRLDRTSRRLTEARYASLRKQSADSTPSGGMERKNSARRALEGIIKTISTSPTPSGSSRPLPEPPAAKDQSLADNSPDRKHEGTSTHNAVPAVDVSNLKPAQSSIQSPAESIATSSLNELIRLAASTEKRMDVPVATNSTESLTIEPTHAL
ncbi:hypothetical protein K435DRAFT_860884 [Dendrothele bispora CBS 962.96]|uniref:Uncharacterized protein n=1 Tax=Dendrothele bispora (strain CBS 962.96) TaxID=1314807 RepID=A0A4S8LWW3_DENBC|nr:hypothetical protein K435DRAFT_860884 [Dendrothele bispora CBS 962.96]